MKKTGFTTTILHSDRLGGSLGKPEHGSLHKPIHTSVAYGYEKAEDLAQVFQNKKKGFAYARQNNPTVAALEQMVTSLEDGAGSVCFSTGMGAIGAVCLSLLKAGDHVVSSAFLFGNTNSLLTTLTRFGVSVAFVDATRAENVEAALTDKTVMVLCETIANPVTQVADLRGIGEICARKRLLFMVDNTMTSAYLFRPKEVKAHLVVNSLTKFMGGHGDALAGAVTDTGLYDWTGFSGILDTFKAGEPRDWALLQLRKKGLRDFGATLSPEAAHSIAIGAETMALRIERASDNALAIARFLSRRAEVKTVNYPGLAAHPQAETARALFRRGGALLSFELQDGLDCMAFLDRLEVCINSSNLGDNRTLVIPVAQTIYYEMGEARRREMGIGEGLIRMSVGIEDEADLLADLEGALA